jgi:hypothetical protein
MRPRHARLAAFTVAALVAVPDVAAKLKQTITFVAPPDRLFGPAPTALSATASSGLPVTFESRTRSVCTVAGATVTPVTVGKCTIRASQDGNATYTAAPNADRSFSIAKGVQTITFGALTSRRLNSAPFNVAATASSGLAVGFASLAPAVCTVSGTLVSLVAVGTCVVRASQPGNTNYAAAPVVDQGFAVTPAVSKLQFQHDAAGNVVRIFRVAVQP